MDPCCNLASDKLYIHRISQRGSSGISICSKSQGRNSSLNLENAATSTVSHSASMQQKNDKIWKAKRQMGMSGKSAQILRYPSVWVFERPQQTDAPNQEAAAPPPLPVCRERSLYSRLQLQQMTEQNPTVYIGCCYLLICPLYTCFISPSLTFCVSLFFLHNPLSHSPASLSVSLTLYVVSSSMAPVPNHLPPAWVCDASFPGPMLPHLAPSQLQLVWHLSIFPSVISHPPPYRPRTYGTSASYLQNWQRQSQVVFPQLLSIGFLYKKHRMGTNGERRLNPTRDKSLNSAG